MGDKSAFDRLVDFGAAFDWIGPGLACLRHAAHGGGHTFTVPPEYGREAPRRLRAAKITCWGGGLVGDQYAITVAREHAEQAQAILDRARIPILAGGFEVPRRLENYAPAKPRGQSRLWGLLDGEHVQKSKPKPKR